MAHIPFGHLRRYLLHGQISRLGCSRAPPRTFLPRALTQPILRVAARSNHTTTSSSSPSSSPAQPPPRPSNPTSEPLIPIRKQLKDQARALKAAGAPKRKKKNADNQTVPGWELTVGIEIHAQLNTRHKLFSHATTPASASSLALSTTPPLPNSSDHVTLFDLALPGSQPIFQPATLIPAVRAALALNCVVQRVSRFDRKHYFHWDQPAGYQITQYYEPFARDGHLELFARDGIAAEDGEGVRVGIKQVQMEQDTAKTIAQAGGVHWLDFNRVGVPLIEIITLPDIHHPATAAAFVRKVQMMLNAVDSCVSGMEAGGLRADVNVSVRRTGDPTAPLGTRTEIKNLSSFKAVEDAIIAERDRQISVLEVGGVVAGETRGWSLGSTETRRLRGKEGEVDYRYMPDPDLGPVVIGDDLVAHLRGTMGVLPDAELEALMEAYGLSAKDGLALMLLDDGSRIQYFYNVLDAISLQAPDEQVASYAPLAANWCLHELGKLTEVSSDLAMTPDGECRVPSAALAQILYPLHERRITAKVAKELLWAVFRGDVSNVRQAIEDGDLWFRELSSEKYEALADEVIEGEQNILNEFARFKDGKSKAYPQGKLMHLVGKMMRAGPDDKMDPQSVERILRARIEDVYLPVHMQGR